MVRTVFVLWLMGTHYGRAGLGCQGLFARACTWAGLCSCTGRDCISHDMYSTGLYGTVWDVPGWAGLALAVRTRLVVRMPVLKEIKGLNPVVSRPYEVETANPVRDGGQRKQCLLKHSVLGGLQAVGPYLECCANLVKPKGFCCRK
jgi:hypothetical protein